MPAPEQPTAEARAVVARCVAKARANLAAGLAREEARARYDALRAEAEAAAGGDEELLWDLRLLDPRGAGDEGAAADLLELAERPVDVGRLVRIGDVTFRTDAPAAVVDELDLRARRRRG